MSDWKHGYYAESGYTYGYYAETAPVMLAWAALLQGAFVPVKKFRYLDAGCGQGLNLILIAACHPDSEFVGIDFLPEHIAHANSLANACGLSNVKFIEADFTELADAPSSLGQFDYVICHGITTWIAPTVRGKLFEVIGKALKPGGIFYNSYNTLPGWLTATPFQHLVLQSQHQHGGAAALKNATDLFADLQIAEAALFKQLPLLSERLKSISEQDPAYLVQEYNNQYWQPVFVTSMMDELSAVKLSFLGSATLPDIFDASYSTSVRQLLNKYTQPALREQLRDYAVNQSFRRDIYIKGKHKTWKFQQQSAILNSHFIVNPMRRRPAPGEPFLFKSGAIEIKGKHQTYSELLDIIQAHTDGISVGELLKSKSWKHKLSDTVTSLTYLLHGRWLGLVLPDTNDMSAAASNAALARQVCVGAPYKYMSLPKIGAAVNLKELEWFLLTAALDKLPQAQWHTFAQTMLNRHGRSIRVDGTEVDNQDKLLKILKDEVKRFATERLPFFKKMGAVE